MEIDRTKGILKILLKDFSVEHTITSLAKETGMTRVGTWKVLKKAELDKLILLSQAGKGKTSTYLVRLNWESLLLKKLLSLALTEDAMKHQRWLNNFSELENKMDFLIIYGSILHYPKEANDIDILGIVPNKNKFLEIEEAVKKIQKTQLKKIHILNFTLQEFKQELQKPNKALIEAVKKGVVLFGQDKFIKFAEGVLRK